MSDAITGAHSLKKVVAIINQPEASAYYGGADTWSAEQLAGQYAYDAAVDSGYTLDRDIEAQLENLYDAGANFDLAEALEEAVDIKKALRPAARSLSEYIDEEFGGSQRAFAAAQGVQPPQVTQWINREMLVIDDCLYSYRRDLEKPA